MSNISYTKINWQAYPSKATKITAQNLGVMDQGIKDCADAIDAANTSISNLPVCTRLWQLEIFSKLREHYNHSK